MLGALLTRLLAEPQDVLATMVLGNTFAGAAVLAVGLWLSLRQEWPLAITVVALLLLVLLGGEVLPKTLAVRKAESWALRVARPLALLHRLARPLHQFAQRLNRALLGVVVPQSVKPHPSFTDAEYRELVELAFQQGTLPQSARDIILQIIHLDRRTAKDVLRPRSRMAAIPDDSSIEDMIAAAKKFRHRRLPLYDETPDTIVGVLNTRTLLLDPTVDLAEAIELSREATQIGQRFKDRDLIAMGIQTEGLALVAAGAMRARMTTPWARAGAGRGRLLETRRAQRTKEGYSCPGAPSMDTMGSSKGRRFEGLQTRAPVTVASCPWSTAK